MRNHKIRIGTLLVGILTALAIVISQLFYFEVAGQTKAEVKTEQQEDQSDAGDEAYITLPSSTLPSSFHIELDQSFCLLEILCEEEEDAEQPRPFSLSITSFFQNLFGATISPNAP